MATPLRVLILEDNPRDAKLMLHELQRAGFQPEWFLVDNEADYTAHLDPALDVILADGVMPGFDAEHALRLVQELGLSSEVPLIVVTGSLSEERAVEFMKLGAVDYLLKDRLVRLGQAVSQALEKKRLAEGKHRAEERLRESQAMLELVLDSIPLGVFWKDRNSVYRGANRVSREAMGLETQAVVGLTDFDALPFQREQAEFYVRTDREVMDLDRAQYGIVETMTLADGSTIWLETNKMPMHDSAGNVTGVLGTWQDITERKRANEELIASRERLAVLSRQLIAAQENERRHLARELHDEIGQSLTAIKLNLRALQSTGARPNGSLVQETVDIVDRILQQARNLALDLRPPMLDDIGLAAALRWCLDRLAQRAGFTGTFLAEPPDCSASKDIETACFRVAQESLTNIARHANARHVRMELRRHDTELELLVQDDGIGFDVPAARERAARGASLGLLGVQERTQLMGGRLEIESAPSHGTAVRARFPLVASPLSEGGGTRSERSDAL